VKRLPDEISCSNCGATIPADSLFCERCGQPLGRGPTEPPAYEPVTKPYEPPPRAPMPPPRAPMPPPPRRPIDTRLLLSAVGTVVAVIFLFATVIGPGLPFITGPHASPSGGPSVTANPSYSSPTPTVKPTTADYSSYFTSAFTGGGYVVAQPFVKSTNDRGNDVYQGIIKNTSSGFQYKSVIELTQSSSDAKQLFDQTVAQKTNEGFVNQPDWVAFYRARYPDYTDVWIGKQGGQYVNIYSYYDSGASSWLVRTDQ
jgi:hypothetical protein